MVAISEIFALLFGVAALGLTIAAMAVPTWLRHNDVLVTHNQGIDKIAEYSAFKSCLGADCVPYHNLEISEIKEFLLAVSSFISLALILNVAAIVILIIFSVVNKLKRSIVKFLIFCGFGIAAVCALIAFAVFVGVWKQRYFVDTSQFGAGPWLALVAFILNLLAFCVSVTMHVEITIN